jgi:hypothetical protein
MAAVLYPDTSSPDDIAQHKLQSFAMLDDVVNDPVKDRIDGAGFQYFAFPWRVARDAINRREVGLNTSAGKVI